MANRKIKANIRSYKGFNYTYSHSRGCWKVYHHGLIGFLLMDYSSEADLKKFISSKAV